MDRLELPEKINHEASKIGNKDLKLKRNVVSKCTDGNLKGAVRLLACSEGVAPRNYNTLRLLKLKHPPSPADLTVAGEKDIRKALSSFRPESAGRPDGLRSGYLLALVSRKAAEAGVRLTSSLTDFVN